MGSSRRIYFQYQQLIGAAFLSVRARDVCNRDRTGRKSSEGETKNLMEPQVGSILEGKVTTITKFGAFVALEGGGSGLVHISEIAHTFVEDVHDFLQTGQTVKVLVLSAENGKVNLSIKKAQAEHRAPPRSAGTSRPAPQVRSGRSAPPPPSGDQAFEDKLKQFLSSSEGKMADLNRSLDGKRGGGRRRR